MVRRATAVLLALVLLLGSAPAISRAQAPPPPGALPAAAADAIGATPPRLGYAQGPVSFWRPGAADWAPAQVNTPLAEGDELFTGHEGLIELQVGGRAYVRGWGDTQLGLVNQEPDFLQLKVTAGHATFDLRSVEPGRSIEVDTPHAAFAIDTPGYYRVDVTPERTSFTTRRSGRAAMTPAGGQPMAIAPSEEVVIEGGPTPSVRSFAAHELDVFDRWNYARTDELLDSVSARYVPPQVYGADDLDHHGTWREVPTYGAIWVPQGVPAGWAPYSTGRWVADPIYGWTWVDTAPWGWAPYHYGRWVFVNGYWAWAPGPIVVRPVYAPALVAFFSAPGITVSIGTPFVSWVALGWGEPVVPWWGRPGYIGRPHWSGWGGPRVVNNVVVNKTTVVNVTNINVYRNTTVNNAVVGVRREGFGRGVEREVRLEQTDVSRLRPIHGRLDVKPDATSYVASTGTALARPAESTVTRQVVATRPPRHSREKLPPAVREGSAGQISAPVSVPAPKIVPAPKRAQAAPVPARPPLGASDVERTRRSEPPRLEATPRQGGAAPPAVERDERKSADTQRDAGTPRREVPQVLRDGPVRPETPGNARGRAPGNVTPPQPSAVTPPQQPAPRQTQPAPVQPAPQVQQAPARPQPTPPAAAHAPQQGPPPAARGPQPERPQPAAPAVRQQQPQQQGQPGAPPLPGEPANRVFPGRSEIKRPNQPVPAASHQSAPTPARGIFSPDRGNGHPPAKPPAPAAQHKGGGRDDDRAKGGR